MDRSINSRQSLQAYTNLDIQQHDYSGHPASAKKAINNLTVVRAATQLRDALEVAGEKMKKKLTTTS